MEAPSLRLNGAGLLAEGAALLQDQGQPGDPLQLQRVLKLAAASIERRADPATEGHLVTRAMCILGRVLEAAGASSGSLAADTALAGQQAAAASAADEAMWAQTACWAHLVRATRPSLLPRLPALTTPADSLTACSNYLEGVRSSLAGLAAGRCGAEAGGTAERRQAQAVLRRSLRDDREAAAEVAADPADPQLARLVLRPLAASRTQAAITAKLVDGAVARQRAVLVAALEAADCKAQARRQLLSSERAALLGASCSDGRRPRLDPLTALQRLLRTGLQQRQGQPPAEGELRCENAAVALRRRLALGVLAQHKEQRKAWQERKQREQKERLEALRGNDVEEYMRLVAGQGSRRNTRLDTLLSQTDNCLRQLATRLQASGTGDALLATHAARGSPSLACGAPGAAGSSGAGSPAAASPPGPGSAGGEGIAALEQSHEAWNRLAQAFQADVPHQPQLLTGGELREYQMKGLRWMVGLHQRSLNGILADEMGLGKTIQVIALVCHLAGELRERRPFLIAVPSSVLPNWEAELQRWAPSLKVICYRGDPDAREEVWRRQMRGGRGGQAGPGTHVVLTTYDFLMSKTDRPRLSRVHWSYICVDEGHRLKNAGCKLNAELRTYRAGHRLLLTGTPLQNSIGELWSLLNFLMPTLFDSGEDFEAWFGGADRRNASGASAGGASAGGDSSDDEEGAAARAEAAMLTEEEALIVTNRLHQVLRPFMLRRLKESVASELPQKREHLLPVLPSPYQQALFRLMQQELQRSAAGGGKGILKGVNNVLMEMRNVCNHPLISRLHAEGAETALLPHCLPPEVRLCGKLELLDRLLVKLRAGGHKVLLFCTMTRALDVISDHLDWRGFSHLRMDGATAAAERGELVSRFNDPAGGVLVFLLSIRAGGVGLNLQAADTVIMYDTDFNPQMDLQAQARAHRMGQKREVLVLRLKTVGTVEERIVAVASDKAQLADRSITGGFFDGKTSAEERQRYLLDTIRSSQRAAAPLAGSGDGGDGGGALSDAQLNALLARGEGELELFEAEDRRMRETELASWQAMQRGTTAGSSGGAAAAGRAAQLGYSRLAGEDEVAPLVAQAAELLQPKRDEDEGRELGRGKRQRGAAAYRDLPEREFNRLCRDGVEAGQVPVPLLAGCRNGSREAEKAGGTEQSDQAQLTETAHDAASAGSLLDQPVDLVRVVFSSHLDVGFTNTDAEVINLWFHQHYPRAIQVAEELRKRGGPERLVFLTHSWLVALYLDCPQHIGIRCPNSTEAFEAAVRRGDIYWHALPHVAQAELYDPPLLEAAVQLSQRLADRFGLPHALTMNQRDVPGLTRAAIPILGRQGVKALMVGVNGVSAPPAVPWNTPFWWRDEPSGTQLLSFWHPGGYSGDPVDSRDECVRAPGSRTRLCLSWNNDNLGPPSTGKVLRIFKQVRQQFPGARGVASTLDEYVKELLEQAPQMDLPVVTAEIGDTWIHGVGSDPAKVAEYRALLRWRRGALQQHGAEALRRFDTLLMKIPEHTWSVNVPLYLLDGWTWINEEFHREIRNLTNTGFIYTIGSWLRQRRYIDWAVQALDGAAADEARQVVNAVRAGNRVPEPSATGFQAADLAQPLRFAGHHWAVTLSPETGAIVGLEPQAADPGPGQQQGRQGGRKAGPDDAAALVGLPAGGSLASPAFPLAEVVYSTYSADNFVDYFDSYHFLDNWGWFGADFAKEGMPTDFPQRNTTPQLQEVWDQQGEDGTLRLITMTAFREDLVEDAGAPQALWTEITAPAGSRELQVAVTWELKTPTRLPEALWVRWRPDPAAVNASTWVLHKLGQPISPLEVILNGSRSLHAVGDKGVSVQTAGGATLRIISLDAPLVSPGEPWPFPNLSKQPDLREGVAHNLANNIWGTNYPQWIPWRAEDATMRFRFVVRLEGEEGAQAQQAAAGHEQPAAEQELRAATHDGPQPEQEQQGQQQQEQEQEQEQQQKQQQQAGDIASDEHVATARWVGQAMTGNALSALAVGFSRNSKDAKKNALVAGGATWAFASAMHLVNVNSGVQKTDVGLGSAAFAALMAGLCLWRGLAKNGGGRGK
ncbi:hypothetical protein ABPG75_006084 [Micractinium tetrahymenae]